ncbi:MAG: PAS domain S-box protein [Betaproteobacteria bacterium]|nr:PAS domain S-box protein [Betaproteobacteria bacterium]
MSPLARFFPLAAALITTVAVLAGVFKVDRLEQEHLTQQNRSRTLDQLSIIRGKIESTLNSRVFLGRGLVAYASTHPGISTPEFQLFAAALIRQQSGIRSIQLAKGSIVSHIYPLKGNEAALGLKLLEIPAQRGAVQQAIESRNTVVAGPVDLVQGGKAFISRTPVFLSPAGGEPGSGAYWGLATIVLDMAPLFEEAGLSQDLFALHYALRGKDGAGANGETFWGDPELFEKDSVRLDITLPNGSWQIAAMPEKKWAVPDSAWLRQGGILLALVAGMLVWFLARNPDRLRQMVQQTTSALRESEKKYRYLVQDANSIILQVDEQGKIIFINEYAQHFFGWNESEMLGLSLLEALVPKDAQPGENLAAMIEDMSQRRHAEEGNRSEHENIRKNGERIWISWSNRAIHDSQGRFTGFLCVGTDISERKKAEILLREAHASLEAKVAERTAELKLSNDHLKSEITERRHAEEKLYNQLLFTQALFEAIPSPVFYKNRKGEYLGCNQAFEKAFGLPRQKIMGTTVYDVMPKDLADIYYAKDEALFHEPGLQIYESQVGLADGTRRDVIFYKATFTDMSGELGGLVGVILDITERKQMEAALLRAHDELEERVQERTSELAKINGDLNVEITYRMQVEEKLWDSQTRLLKAQRIAHLGHWDWDIIGGSLHWSDEIYRIFWLTPQQFGATYEAFLKSVHPDDRTYVVQSVDTALSEGKPYSIDHRIVLPDGSIRHVHEQAEVEFDNDGRPVRMHGTVQDISERKQMEMALRESEERFRILVQQAADAFFLTSLQGRFIDVNRQACDSLGYSREELLTMSVLDVDVGFTAEQAAELWEGIAPGSSVSFEGRHRRKDGTTFPVEVVGSIIEIGDKPYIFGLARNITERKQTEDKLRRQAQIIDQTHDSVITSDLDGIITFWNNGARQMFGYSAEEALGRHISMLDTQSQQHDNRRQAFLQLFDQGIYETEIMRRKKSGEIIHIHLILTLLKNANNENIGIVGYSIDITERKRLEQQIIEISEEGQKRIGQELHDGLGQHLTGVAFLGKALEQKLAAKSLPEVADATEIVNFLNQAITQTRVLARGLFPVELENNGLMSALEQLASGVNKLFGIVCIFRCANPILVNDRLTAINLYRIAQEAVANAARHSKAGNILIELATEDDRTNLTITDDGIGLDPHKENQGMGLHIMRYRANMLDASISLQRIAGGGTEVRVSLNQ